MSIKWILTKCIVTKNVNENVNNFLKTVEADIYTSVKEIVLAFKSNPS